MVNNKGTPVLHFVSQVPTVFVSPTFSPEVRETVTKGLVRSHRVVSPSHRVTFGEHLNDRRLRCNGSDQAPRLRDSAPMTGVDVRGRGVTRSLLGLVGPVPPGSGPGPVRVSVSDYTLDDSGVVLTTGPLRPRGRWRVTASCASFHPRSTGPRLLRVGGVVCLLVPTSRCRSRLLCTR